MLVIDTAVPLGQLSYSTTPAFWPRHHLLHLPDVGLVVAATCRAGDQGWHCVIVASRTPRPGPVVLSTDQLAAASTSMLADAAHDPDGYAMLWQARVFQRWPGGPVFALARLIAERLRLPGDLRIPSSALADHGRIAGMLPNTRPPAVARLLDRLGSAGLLVGALAGDARITVPGPAAA
jgi:hypothetical protein